MPTVQHQPGRVQLLKTLGYKAAWPHDVPFNVPTFGDAGQTFHPFTHLGYLARQTSEITLEVSSIALPLHHRVHVVK
ncbi:hypothetical protein HPE56_00950 [Maribacter sp. ANRC-HE7]|uniref:Uncharacterized protein n=1 Tax=Maribacter aquimaris TaxID=2737171 RepID=A0ABR7UXJ7_9FLAO|nr:hypothetical protein [Maribacter aquimaris]MBD0776344.1 hypothetical protein [Maribacter aquimaris]